MKKKMWVLAVLFLAAAVFCCYQLFSYYGEIAGQEDMFEELAEQVAETEDDPENGEDTPLTDSDGSEGTVLARYADLYLQNPDMVGWISIPGTTIDYPVMQTPEDPDYYLHRNFDREYSSLGVPYVQANCRIGESDNIIIYGHHIKGGRMFGALESYKSKDFFEEHPVIEFDTLTEEAQYRVIAVFKTVAYSSSGFRYYDFVDAADAEEFDAYVAECKALAFYDTGDTAQYGDKLLALSTCEYSAKNGRLVVVAKKIT